MRKCQCGEMVQAFSLYPVCARCFDAYLQELPHRSGLTLAAYLRERAAARATGSAQRPRPTRQVHLLGVTLDACTLDDVMRRVEQWVEEGLPRQIVTPNVDFVRIAREDERFRAVLNNAGLSVCDGKPLVWAARWTGQELPQRITGTDMIEGIAALAQRRGETMFLLGAAPGIAARAAEVLQDRYPGLGIATYSPPMGSFSDEENRAIIERVRASGAKYLCVGLGSPRGEVWINEHLAELGVPIAIGVGGVFNFLAGTVKRAPRWMQQSGLEWLFRVKEEPARLWRRYFLEDLPVFLRMMTQPVTEPLPLMDEPTPLTVSALERMRPAPETLDMLRSA